ncbi:hypothetical protein JB92DRAFT_2886044 [Gautieria morchelliformis]|nr:hypothetical protein JB92DRAFT_2886044 [Gautieria morchelliformis]
MPLLTPVVTLANPGYAPTPPSQEPELVAPERPMGLFGPRSPNSFPPNINSYKNFFSSSKTMPT